MGGRPTGTDPSPMQATLALLVLLTKKIMDGKKKGGRPGEVRMAPGPGVLSGFGEEGRPGEVRMAPGLEGKEARR